MKKHFDQKLQQQRTGNVVSEEGWKELGPLSLEKTGEGKRLKKKLKNDF